MNHTQLKIAFSVLALICELYAVHQYIHINDVSASDDTVEVFNRGLAELQSLNHKE